MGNNVLPARAGEVLRVVPAGRAGAGKRRWRARWCVERVLDALALGVILVVVVFAVLRDTALPSGRPLIFGGAAVVLLAVGAIILQLMRSGLARSRDWIRPLADAPRALLGRDGAVLLAGSFVIWAAEASVYLAVAHATALDISAEGALYLVALTNLFRDDPRRPRLRRHVRRGGGLRRPAHRRQQDGGPVLPDPPALHPLRAHHWSGFILLVTRYGGSRVRDALRSTRAAAEPV